MLTRVAELSVSYLSETVRSGLMHAERPWGVYSVLAEPEDFKVKTIEVQPGQRLSYQRHVFVEVQDSDYVGEDDIVRLDDDYGR